MKIKAETPTSAQHNGTGIDSSASLALGVSMKMGAVSVAGSGAVMSGCVFDIFTVFGAGLGSGIIEMRAVSFLGPGGTIRGGVIDTRAVSFLGLGGGITGGGDGGITGTADAFCATGGGIIEMRAVSFFGPGDAITGGNGGGTVGAGGAFCVTEGGGGGTSGGSIIGSAIDGV